MDEFLTEIQCEEYYCEENLQVASAEPAEEQLPPEEPA